MGENFLPFWLGRDKNLRSSNSKYSTHAFSSYLFGWEEVEISTFSAGRRSKSPKLQLKIKHCVRLFQAHTLFLCLQPVTSPRRLIEPIKYKSVVQHHSNTDLAQRSPAPRVRLRPLCLTASGSLTGAEAEVGAAMRVQHSIVSSRSDLFEDELFRAAGSH